MVKVIICYDDNDSRLGDYFKSSYTDIKARATGNIYVHSINGLDCNETNIQAATAEIKPFIFIGLSHGSASQLGTSNDIYVDSSNIAHFKDSLFYSTACSTALDLGKKLISVDCMCYVGYSKDTYATYDDYHSVYIECENYCIKEFLNPLKSIQTAYNEMLDYFDEQIDLLFAKDIVEVLVAMELQHNKDSFVIYGKTNLKKSNFEIEL